MFKKKERNIFKIVTIILSIVLLILVNYIVVDKISDKYKDDAANAYREGYSKANDDIILAIYEETSDCTTTNLIIGEETRTLVDVACIQ